MLKKSLYQVAYVLTLGYFFLLSPLALAVDPYRDFNPERDLPPEVLEQERNQGESSSAPQASLITGQERRVKNLIQREIRKRYADLFQIPPVQEGFVYSDEDLKRVGMFREDDIEAFERWDFSSYDKKSRTGEVRFVLKGQTRIGELVSRNQRPRVRGETWHFSWLYSCELQGRRIEFCRALEPSIY